MRRNFIRSLLLAAAAGGVMFQASSCTDISTGITAVATTVTAGGVIYLVVRVLE